MSSTRKGRWCFICRANVERVQNAILPTVKLSFEDCLIFGKQNFALLLKRVSVVSWVANASMLMEKLSLREFRSSVYKKIIRNQEAHRENKNIIITIVLNPSKPCIRHPHLPLQAIWAISTHISHIWVSFLVL